MNDLIVFVFPKSNNSFRLSSSDNPKPHILGKKRANLGKKQVHFSHFCKRILVSVRLVTPAIIISEAIVG